MRIVVLNPSDFRHWTLYVKGCGPWTDTTTPRTERPVRFFRCGSIWHRYTDGRPLSIMPATRIA